MDQISAMALEVINHPEVVCTDLTKDLQQLEIIARGMETLRQRFEGPEVSPAEIQHKMGLICKNLKRLCRAQQRTTTLFLLMAIGGDLVPAAGKAANKLGHGQEALQATFNAKVKGF